MPRPIDTLHQGRERAVCCWQVGEVLVDPGPTASIENVLAELGDFVPRAVLLTHIHLDHATSTGTLARRWPGLQVYVHELGARHMLDPSRLWDSATRLYGAENMDKLWGTFEPVPADRLHVLHGGETLQIGADRFEVAYTPGHAKHHVSYLRDGTAFVGDVCGVRQFPDWPVTPPTPPPDIDVELWHQSLQTLRAWQPRQLAITHFGMIDDPAAHFEQLEQRLDRWAADVRAQDFQTWCDTLGAQLAPWLDAAAMVKFREFIPFDQNYAGLRRYWEKRAEAAVSPANA